MLLPRLPLEHGLGGHLAFLLLLELQIRWVWHPTWAWIHPHLNW